MRLKMRGTREEHRRLHLGQVFDDLVDASQMRHRGADRDQQCSSPVWPNEWAQGKNERLRSSAPNGKMLVHGDDVGHDVAVREDDALGVAGGARRVDEARPCPWLRGGSAGDRALRALLRAAPLYDERRSASPGREPTTCLSEGTLLRQLLASSRRCPRSRRRQHLGARSRRR